MTEQKGKREKGRYMPSRGFCSGSTPGEERNLDLIRKQPCPSAHLVLYKGKHQKLPVKQSIIFSKTFHCRIHIASFENFSQNFWRTYELYCTIGKIFLTWLEVSSQTPTLPSQQNYELIQFLWKWFVVLVFSCCIAIPIDQLTVVQVISLTQCGWVLRVS